MFLLSITITDINQTFNRLWYSLSAEGRMGSCHSVASNTKIFLFFFLFYYKNQFICSSCLHHKIILKVSLQLVTTKQDLISRKDIDRIRQHETNRIKCFHVLAVGCSRWDWRISTGRLMTICFDTSNRFTSLFLTANMREMMSINLFDFSKDVGFSEQVIFLLFVFAVCKLHLGAAEFRE